MISGVASMGLWDAYENHLGKDQYDNLNASIRGLQQSRAEISFGINMMQQHDESNQPAIDTLRKESQKYQDKIMGLETEVKALHYDPDAAFTHGIEILLPTTIAVGVLATVARYVLI